jgi:thiosulfate/3-mercaptopyruvate sulfurtransferase
MLHWLGTSGLATRIDCMPSLWETTLIAKRPCCPTPPQYTDDMKLSAPSVRVLYATVAILALIGVLGFADEAAHAQNAAVNPWRAAQVTQPSQLAALLSQPTGAKPVILQVGFQVLYKSKHIPGSIYAGPASKPEGLAALKHAARALPKDADIYIYCGCCPINKCPNIHPAFATLKATGFTHLHVVMLPTSFGKDWVANGYPVAGESAPGQ